MANSRQPKPRPALRLCAAFCVLIWLAAVSYCSLETFIGHAEAGDHHAAQAATHASAESHDKSDHSHDSDKNGNSQDTCCDSLNATPQHGSSLVLLKPDLGKLPSFSFLWMATALTLDAPEPAPRQAQHPVWIFTPEVCLGPAFRSHAPPLAV